MLKIYGFGSYFAGNKFYKDIDILIVHFSNSYISCLEAIALKKSILALISNVDVSMLSISEESSFNFIIKSQAILLHSTKFESSESTAKKILNLIKNYDTRTNKMSNMRNV